MKQFIVLRVYTAALSKLNEPKREFIVTEARTQVANLI